MLLKEIVDVIEGEYSPDLAYEWDNVGLLVGDFGQDVKRVLLALDADEKVIDEAVERNVDMIVTHHPLLFKGVKKINTSSGKGRAIIKLIQSGISLYSMHTNFDISKNGMNDYLCEKMGIKNIQVLDKTKIQKLVKIAFYVPKTHEEDVRKALAGVGAGHIGDYDNCSFSAAGEGRFRPLEGSNPYIGKIDEVSRVEEVKIESVIPMEDLKRALEAAFDAHPYEEVAYDSYELLNRGIEDGMGRIGDLESEINLEEFSRKIKRILGIEALKVAGDPEKKIKRVAVVSGSGAEFAQAAYSLGADAIVTGDVKYHQAQHALEKGIAVIDAGHYGSEKIFTEIVEKFLNKKIKGIDILTSNCSDDVFWNL